MAKQFIKRAIRCVKCGRKLYDDFGESHIKNIEIKCPRCGYLNKR
ncbi:MAG: Com family DNA-binding transcriptional regulator [Bacteroidales bacterium]|nr:Com family DNA-binding transcriptional regulator [Bacteroidales bacterium]